MTMAEREKFFKDSRNIEAIKGFVYISLISAGVDEDTMVEVIENLEGNLNYISLKVGEAAVIDLDNFMREYRR